MAEESSNACSQEDDFLTFTLDDKPLDVDLVAAQSEFAKIDIVHRDDAWHCFSCLKTFPPPPVESIAEEMFCQECGAKGFRRDEAWLDDVATYVRSLGAAKCGRRAAGAFYMAVLRAGDELKKKSTPTLESPTGTELTLKDGAELDVPHI